MAGDLVVRRARGGSGRARLEEVARLAGVSTATASRVFNEPSKVSSVVQARVREAAAALNWIPNAAGRALASSRTHIAGAIIPTLDNEIFARQVSGLQAVFAEHGFTLLLGCSNYDPEESLNQVQAMLARGVEALALVGEDHPPELFDALSLHRVPYVVMYSYRADSPHPCVGFDNRAAFRTIADHILSLGHRRIATIFQPMSNNDRVTARLAGVRDALAPHGIALTAADLHVGPSTMDFGAQAFRRLRESADPPTAVICGNDNLALGVLSAAADLGVRIPQSCSVTGFDDLAISSRLKPNLTTMWVNNLQIGQLSAKHLLGVLGDVPSMSSTRIEPQLRIRATTARVSRPTESTRGGVD